MLTDVVLIFRNVGEMREIAERAHDTHGFGDRHAVENDLEFPSRQFVVIAMETDGGLPDTLDEVENVRPFLLSHGVAENAPETTNIRPQQSVVVGK